MIAPGTSKAAATVLLDLPRFKAQLARRRVPQRKVAAAAGIAETDLSRRLRRSLPIARSVAEALARCLDCELAEIVEVAP